MVLRLVAAFALLSAPFAFGQSFHIRVLNAKDGKPVKHEKVSVSLKGEKGARDYETDENGEVALTLNASAKIFAATEWWVTCRKLSKNEDGYIPVAEIQRDGVTAENSCGKAASETFRGVLVLFARKASFLENFRR
jgi:hypothetical protein